MAGQSNMQGESYWVGSTSVPSGYEYLNTQPNVAFWANTDYSTSSSWGALAEGTGRPDNGGNGGFGPELSFGYAMAQTYPQNNIAIIKATQGATSLEYNWDVTPEGGGSEGASYVNMIGTVNSALTALTSQGDTYNVRGVLWLQGESDANDGTMSNAYQDNLTDLISKVRTDLGDSELPFIIGQISCPTPQDRYDNSLIIRAAEQAVANADPFTDLADLDSCDQTTYNVHFTNLGLVQIGDAFAASELVAVPEPATMSLLGLGGLALLRRRRR